MQPYQIIGENFIWISPWLNIFIFVCRSNLLHFSLNFNFLFFWEKGTFLPSGWKKFSWIHTCMICCWRLSIYWFLYLNLRSSFLPFCLCFFKRIFFGKYNRSLPPTVALLVAYVTKSIEAPTKTKTKFLRNKNP